MNEMQLIDYSSQVFFFLSQSKSIRTDRGLRGLAMLFCVIIFTCQLTIQIHSDTAHFQPSLPKKLRSSSQL